MKTNWSKIAKYIFGEASQNEQRDIESWIEENPERKETINNLAIYLNNNKMEAKKQHVDVDKAWEKLKNRIEESGEKNHTPIVRMRRSIMRYAAALILILGFGTIGYFSYNYIDHTRNYISIETQRAEKKESLYLPDGSVASLNGNTRINYPKEFNTSERFVDVKGEVFFDVENDPEKPFVIKANQAKIKVLGTSFNVRTNLPDGAVEVYVKSGKVKFFKADNEDEAIFLEPGYVGVLDNSKPRKMKNNDINYLSWKTGKLLFKDTDLLTVTEKLNHTYNVEIIINNPEIKDLQLSGSFDDASVEQVLEVITRTFNLKLIKKAEDKYLLTSS